MASSAQHDTEWAKALLREIGLRATAARIAVLKHLSVHGGPQSHAEVVEALREEGFDQSTLFRCLNEFADAGVVARLDLGDQLRRFELTDVEDAGAAKHAHFMCVDCGQLSCLDGYQVEVTPCPGAKPGTLGQVTEVLLRGQCSECGS